MATFRCKASGNTVSFDDEADIASMRKMEHYVEVLPAAEPSEPSEKKTLSLPKKAKE